MSSFRWSRRRRRSACCQAVMPVGGVGAEEQLGVAADARRCRRSCLVHSTRAALRRRRSRPRPGTTRAQTMSPARTPGRPGRPGARPRWCRAASRAATSQRTRRRHRIDAGHARPLADHQGVLERASDHAGLRQRQRIAGALQLPQLAAVGGVEGAAPRGRRRGRRPARRPPAARSRRGRRALLPLASWPPSSATSSLSRVTTAATAVAADAGRELAPTLARQSSRPLAASRATHGAVARGQR